MYAHSYPAGTPWLQRVHAAGSQQPFPVGLPLHDQDQLTDQVHDAATRGFDTVTSRPHLGRRHVDVCPRQPAAASGSSTSQPSTVARWHRARRPGPGRSHKPGQRNGRPFPLPLKP